jgi:aminoglycoside phosphotransferase (APT) family kinase protein
MTGSIEILPEIDAVREEEDFDHGRLHAYLRDRLAGADRPMEVKRFTGGRSNLTYLLRFDGQEWVLRRPPLGPLPVGGHDMKREYRVLSRLWKAFKPAPRAMLFCDDPSIIGAPFFVMERRKGIVIRTNEPTPAELGDRPETFRKLSSAIIDTLADLHAVNYKAVGLSTLGRPEGFVRRQIVGWMDRWERAKTREVPLMNKLGKWLLENMPPAQPPVLLHNDFFLHNIMFGAGDPGRVAGIFDWEMSTLGDPMVDLGNTLAFWREKTDPQELIGMAQAEIHTFHPGFISRDEAMQRYARRTGRDLSHVYFYWAFSHWKNATIGEQIYVRYVRGQTTDPRFAIMEPFAPALARAAAAVAGGLGFHE